MTWEQSRAWLTKCLPPIADSLERGTQEIRVRCANPAVLTGSPGVKTLPWSPGKTEILRAVEALTERGFHARYEETAQGFLSLRGGHRLGLCGQMGSGGFEEISGFCLRLAGQWPGAADEVIRALATKPVSLLVIGPPGSGKTTLLRDLCRQWSLAGVQAAVNDRRGELAALWQGVPQLDVGPMTDVVAGCPWEKGLFQILSSLRPQVVFTDELAPGELKEVREALLCGVRVCASAHGKDLAAVIRRFPRLLEERLFDAYAVLNRGRLQALYDGEGKPWEPFLPWEPGCAASLWDLAPERR